MTDSVPENTRSDDSTPFSLGASVVLLIFGVGFGYAVTTIFAVAGVAVGMAAGPLAFTDLITKAGLLAGTVSFIVPAWFYMHHVRKHAVLAFRIRPVSPGVIVFTLLLAVGVFILTDALDRWLAPSINGFLDRTIGTLSPELKSDRILARMMEEFTIRNVFSGVLLVLAAVAAAGLCEEMLLRGMFQQALEGRFSAAGAISISSLVFALIHLNPWGGVQILFIALVLGWVAWRTNSIVPTILLHGTNNLLVIVTHNLGQERMTWYGNESRIEAWVLAFGILLAAAGGAGLARKSSRAQ